MLTKHSRTFRSAADDSYTAVIENEDTGPGKFEGEGTVGEWVYDQSLEGWGEEMGDVESSFNHHTLLIWDKPILVHDLDGSEWTFLAARVEEDSDGFVQFSYYATAADAEKVWHRLEAHWEAWGEKELEEEEEEAPSQEEINESVVIDQVGDNFVAYYLNKEIVRAEDEREFWRLINKWMEAEGYWPNIYSVNDHGNVTVYDYEGNAIRGWV